MGRLIDKSAVLMICVTAFALSGDPVGPVAALLVSASASAVIQLMSGTRAALVMVAVCSALCGILPVLFCAFPLIFLDALYEKKWWLSLPAVMILPSVGEMRAEQFMLVMVGIAVALIMYLRISKLEAAVGNLKSLRDEVTEKNMQLAGQNLKLAAAQDNEVHLATLRERNRIAREIHDNVGHMLTRSILQTGALRIINKDEKLKEPLDELKSTLDGAMTSIRTSVHDLHDDSIDLKKTIEEIISAVDSRFDVTLNYSAGEHIPGDIKLCAAGIVKEGVSNCVKHSDGDRIKIVFLEHPAFYQLLVEDNGSGTARDSGSSHGIGLKNMEDRASGVGGRITFTHTEKGFRIFMTIPKER